MTTKCRVILGSARYLSSKLLERLTLGLGDEESGKNTAQHEKSIYLQDVVEPRRLVVGSGAADTERAYEHLGDDGADFAAGGGDTMRSRTITRREAFTGYDEGCSVRTEL